MDGGVFWRAVRPCTRTNVGTTTHLIVIVVGVAARHDHAVAADEGIVAVEEERRGQVASRKPLAEDRAVKCQRVM